METAKKLRQRKCKNPDCGEKFTPFSTLSKACSPTCALKIAKAENEKKRIREERKQKAEIVKFAKAQRAKQRRDKEAVKPRKQLVREAQTEFNKYIRWRDFDKPCIDCGLFYNPDLLDSDTFDAAHFQGIGRKPELRWNEVNVHRAHSGCNRSAQNSAKNWSTHEERYEANLRERIGDSLVDWLKGPHKPLKATNDELRWLRDYYKQRAKEAKAYAESQ